MFLFMTDQAGPDTGRGDDLSTLSAVQIVERELPKSKRRLARPLLAMYFVLYGSELIHAKIAKTPRTPRKYQKKMPRECYWRSWRLGDLGAGFHGARSNTR
jgi:hypothetical protein